MHEMAYNIRGNFNFEKNAYIWKSYKMHCLQDSIQVCAICIKLTNH